MWFSSYYGAFGGVIGLGLCDFPAIMWHLEGLLDWGYVIFELLWGIWRGYGIAKVSSSLWFRVWAHQRANKGSAITITWHNGNELIVMCTDSFRPTRLIGFSWFPWNISCLVEYAIHYLHCGQVRKNFTWIIDCPSQQDEWSEFGLQVVNLFLASTWVAKLQVARTSYNFTWNRWWNRFVAI